MMSNSERAGATDAYNRGETTYNGITLGKASSTFNPVAMRGKGKNMFFYNDPTGVPNRTFTTYQSTANGTPLSNVFSSTPSAPSPAAPAQAPVAGPMAAIAGGSQGNTMLPPISANQFTAPLRASRVIS